MKPVVFEHKVRKNLVRSHKALLVFLQAKHRANETVYREEIIELYTKHAQRKTGREILRHTGQWEIVPYTPDELYTRAAQYLFHGIGSLVKKGMLLVIPNINIGR